MNVRTNCRMFYLIPFLTVLLAFSCSDKRDNSAPVTDSNPDLRTHSREFRKDVIQVTDGVYVAIGYGLANSVMIEGEDGLIIVDTMESAEAAAPVRAAFEEISSKPVRAIIYTHFHTDHTSGARVMAGDDQPVVYSHEQTPVHMSRIANITRETTYRRAMRQFGTLLPEGDLVNAGIGLRLEFDRTKNIATLPPTEVFSGESREIEISGVKIILMHAPGETPDQTVIWLPEKKVLLPADNFYRSFPNLYAIRGTAYRDVKLWVNSLDGMRELGAEYMVPHHTRPVSGAGEIHETLTNYRDAIQFVHDQTIRLMNKGFSTQEIVERVKLPAHLAEQPYLHEYYGTVEWSVRAIFDGYLGWFGGSPADLFPLPLSARAERFAALAGGEERLLEEAEAALASGDLQWALELADQVIELNPDLDRARAVKAGALRGLGEKQIAATARNYYLTSALEAEKKLEIGGLGNIDADLVHNIPLSMIFEGMAVKLDPEKSADVDIVAGFRFPDTGEGYMVHVRRGVAEIQPVFPDDPDISITVDSNVWKEMAAGVRSPALALFKDVEKAGGTIKIVKFLSMFRDDD